MTTMRMGVGARQPAYAPLTGEDSASTRVLPMGCADTDVISARIMDACTILRAAGCRVLSAHAAPRPRVTVTPPACDGARGAMRRRTGLREERVSVVQGVLVSWWVPRLGRPAGGAS